MPPKDANVIANSEDADHTPPLGLIFLILGLQIFFQNIRSGEGKIKIKIPKIFFYLI